MPRGPRNSIQQRRWFRAATQRWCVTAWRMPLRCGWSRRGRSYRRRWGAARGGQDGERRAEGGGGGGAGAYGERERERARGEGEGPGEHLLHGGERASRDHPADRVSRGKCAQGVCHGPATEIDDIYGFGGWRGRR